MTYVDLEGVGKYIFKNGKWMPIDDTHWECSQCGYVVGEIKQDCNYCPRCGSHMSDHNELENVDWSEE